MLRKAPKNYVEKTGKKANETLEKNICQPANPDYFNFFQVRKPVIFRSNVQRIHKEYTCETRILKVSRALNNNETENLKASQPRGCEAFTFLCALHPDNFMGICPLTSRPNTRFSYRH
jgi:hypothetical protein